MVRVSVTINEPLEKVWEFFAEPSNWAKWRDGYGLKCVNPGWETGAELEWAIGGFSKILECTPKKSVYIEGSWGMDTVYGFEAEGNDSTKLSFSMGDPAGAAYTDGGAAQQQKMNRFFQEFKRLVELEK